MALEYIANEDLQLGHGAGSSVSGGSFNITKNSSDKVKILGKWVQVKQIIFSFSGGNGPPPTLPGSVTGSGTITATATKDKAAKSTVLELVMREKDSVSVAMTGQITNPSPPPPTIPYPLGNQPVEISNAGQSKVKGQ